MGWIPNPITGAVKAGAALADAGANLARALRGDPAKIAASRVAALESKKAVRLAKISAELEIEKANAALVKISAETALEKARHGQFSSKDLLGFGSTIAVLLDVVARWADGIFATSMALPGGLAMVVWGVAAGCAGLRLGQQAMGLAKGQVRRELGAKFINREKAQ